MINWTDVENAIHAWVTAASGLAGNHVVWANQNSPRPTTPFITLSIDGPLQFGQDENSHEFDSDGDPGEEIIMRARGTREIVVRSQFFGGGVTGDAGARALADAVRMRLELETYRAPLRAAGVFPFDGGSIRWIPAIVGAGFEARATLESRFYLSDEVEELTTYIETVEITNEDTDESFVVDASE